MSFLSKLTSFFVVLLVGGTIKEELEIMHPELKKIKWYEPFIFWRKRK